MLAVTVQSLCVLDVLVPRANTVSKSKINHYCFNDSECE